MKKLQKVVVEIFSLIIAGYNASEVARILNERKIPTRVQNQWKNGINYVPVHNKGDYMWDNSEVIAIVQNEQYKGIMIQNKCETVGFGDNKKVRKRNKEDWSVVEGAIPRIVSDEMFDEVNKMLRVEARGIEKSTKKRKKIFYLSLLWKKADEFQCSMYTEAPLSKTQDGKDWRMSADFYAEVRSTGQGAGNHKGNL